MKPEVLIIGLGGTIASGARDASGGVVPSLTAADLVAAVPGLEQVAEVSAKNLSNVPSTEISLASLREVIAQAHAFEAAGGAGVVITQGTDTIEETAYVLDLLWGGAIPLVVTGAMRNPTLAGPDGPANLLAAVTTASAPQARGLGVLVVLDDAVHAAAWVQKRDTSATGAFASPSPLGWVAEGALALRARPPRRPVITLPPPAQLPPGGGLPTEPASMARLPVVPILKPGLWQGPEILVALDSVSFDGVVLDLAGGGHVSATWAEPLGALAQKIPVVFASRTCGGRVLAATYGQAGAEIDLLSRGLISAGDLDALKARLLLMLLVMGGRPEEFARHAILTVEA